METRYIRFEKQSRLGGHDAWWETDWSGSKKGAQNKVNGALREKLNAGGILPLEFMLQVMRDAHQDLAVRLEMAKAAAPYLHPRLQAIEHAGKNEKAIPRSLTVRFVSANGLPMPHPNGNLRKMISVASPDLADNTREPYLLPDYRARS